MTGSVRSSAHITLQEPRLGERMRHVAPRPGRTLRIPYPSWAPAPQVMAAATDPVIPDPQLDATGAVARLDLDPLRTGVTHCIVHGFLDDPERRDQQIRRQLDRERVGLDGDLATGVLGLLARVPLPTSGSVRAGPASPVAGPMRYCARRRRPRVPCRCSPAQRFAPPTAPLAHFPLAPRQRDHQRGQFLADLVMQFQRQVAAAPAPGSRARAWKTR